MRNESPPDIDRQVRDAFACRPEAVRRIAAGAMADATPRRLRPWVAGFAATATTVLIAAALVFWPSRRPPSAVEGFSLSGSFTDGVLVVPLPDGSVSIAGDGSRDDRPPDGCGIVLVEGDIK